MLLRLIACFIGMLLLVACSADNKTSDGFERKRANPVEHRFKIFLLESSYMNELAKEMMETKMNQTVNQTDEFYPRSRRQTRQTNSDTAATVLSILPLDRLGTIVGQIMSTGLKEMMNPDVGKKIVNVLENQAPLLLTSLFTNLYTNLRAPGPNRPPSNNTAVVVGPTGGTNGVRPLSNSSSSLLNLLRDRRRK